jgi:CXXX repeat peptide maturase
MLQYLVILLDDTSTSFCHYAVGKQKPKLIELDTLRRAIRFAMVENLTIQFIYPEYDLQQEYKNVIETIDHTKIKPLVSADDETDIIVVDGWDFNDGTLNDSITVIRTTWALLLANQDKAMSLLGKVQRLNIVITDVERLTDEDRRQYKALLIKMCQELETLYVAGHSPQLNLLTDRMMLTEMNNCGAGDTTITLASNGKFYICPGFYYDDEQNSVGDLEKGLDIKNKQLYRLDHAPICRKCDAWQCRRCVWLNRKTTFEVNTPSYEQCVIAHLERNTSRDLMLTLRSKGTFLPEREMIEEINYLDPFDEIINNRL